MRSRKIGLIGCLLVWVTAALLLARGSEWLVYPLIAEPYVPLGTPLTWAGLIAFPLIPLLAVKGFHPPPDRFFASYRAILLATLVLGGSWGLVAYGLAGNWNFSFRATAPGWRGSPAAGVYFWYFTIAAAGLPPALTLIMGLHAGLRGWLARRRGRK